MNVELSREQVEALSELIANQLGDMNYEIADTDNPDFKRDLKDRREIIKGAKEALDAALGQ